MKLKELEKRQLTYEIKSDEKFDKIFDALENKQIHPTNGIFYNGQIFDAYVTFDEKRKQQESEDL